MQPPDHDAPDFVPPDTALNSRTLIRLTLSQAWSVVFALVGASVVIAGTYLSVSARLDAIQKELGQHWTLADERAVWQDFQDRNPEAKLRRPDVNASYHEARR